jgi:hypothetical protein
MPTPIIVPKESEKGEKKSGKEPPARYVDVFRPNPEQASYQCCSL